MNIINTQDITKRVHHLHGNHHHFRRHPSDNYGEDCRLGVIGGEEEWVITIPSSSTVSSILGFLGSAAKGKVAVATTD